MANKYELILRDKQRCLIEVQRTLSRVESSLRIMEQVFFDAKRMARSTWFPSIRRRAAVNTHKAYEEWHKLWDRKFKLISEIADIKKEIQKYEVKLQKAQAYNERRRNLRAEKKKIRQ